MFLIALRYHTVFLLEQRFTFAVLSLLIWYLLFKLFHQSMYFLFTRKANPSSKLGATPFMGLISYTYYHKKSFILNCISYSRTAKQFTSLQKVLCFIALTSMDYKYNSCQLHTTNEIRLHAWIL